MQGGESFDQKEQENQRKLQLQMQSFGRKTEAVPKRSFGLGVGADESSDM